MKYLNIYDYAQTMAYSIFTAAHFAFSEKK